MNLHELPQESLVMEYLRAQYPRYIFSFTHNPTQPIQFITTDSTRPRFIHQRDMRTYETEANVWNQRRKQG